MVKILKGNADWRRIELGSGILTGDDASGCLVGVEELTDYELVTGGGDGRGSAKVARKRKVMPGASVEERLKKRKKKRPRQKNVFRVEDQTALSGGGDDGDAKYEEEDEDGDESSISEVGIQPEDLFPWENIFVPKEVARALVERGFSQPTEIQRLSIPAAIKGRRDLLGAAETGSGKTLAFGIPIIYGIMKNMEKLQNDQGCLQESDDDQNGDGSEFESDREGGDDLEEGGGGCVKVMNLGAPQKVMASRLGTDRLWALVLAPTRELAIQVKDHIEAAAKYTPVKVAVVVGGMSVEKQSRILSKKRPHIVVATPGRLWELITSGEPHLANVHLIKYLAVDETDRMLEKDHFPELRQLLERINYPTAAAAGDKKGGGNPRRKQFGRQNFVFSATLTFVHDPPEHLKKKGKRAKKLTSEQKLKEIMTLLGIADPKVVDVTKKTGTAERLTESRIICPVDEKDVYLHYFLERHPGRTLVFCNSVAGVRRLASLLGLLGAKPLPIHASMHQRQRLNNLDRFRLNPKGILLATDVAARGLDIPNVQHVIHYQVPKTSEGYIHRSGRTARAESEGLTLLLVEPGEVRNYTKICSTLGRVEDLPEFPVDSGGLARARERVRCAREVDLLEMSLRKTSASAAWMEKAAEDMDMILDEDQLPNRPDVEAAAKLRRVCKMKRKRLASLLSAPLFSAQALMTTNANGDDDGSDDGGGGGVVRGSSAVAAVRAAANEAAEEAARRRKRRREKGTDGAAKFGAGPVFRIFKMKRPSEKFQKKKKAGK